MRKPLAAAVAALLGAGLVGSGSAAATPQHLRAASPLSSAQVWLTTPDGANRLADMGVVDFSDVAGATGAATNAPTVVIDPDRTFQTMAGFGAAITDSAASVLYSLSAQERDKVMTELFDPASGDALSYLRQPIGASDFTDGAFYTYDEMPLGETDYDLRHFSVAHDEAQILPLLRQAERINPSLSIVASPWSPPAWMKTGAQGLVGGRLMDDPRIYRAYAEYLVKFIEAYRAHGVHVDAITVQNEPQNRNPNDYPGTDMPSWQEEKVIEQLGPMLRKAHLDTKILAYDHNWAEHPNDAASTPPDESADIGDYPQQVLDSKAAKYVYGVAYHCYFGDPSAMTALHNEYPDTHVYFTECSGSESSNPANTFSDTLKWHARNLIIGATRNWAETVINWNLALNPENGPHTGGCGTCTGVVTIGRDGSVTKNAEYYTLGHLARFVHPGAVRIASTSFGTTGWNGQVMDVAFRNPDGSTVLVAHNENDKPQTFAVRENGAGFSYTLPGGALATFVWQRPSASDGLRALAPTGWTATANPPGPTNPCCSGDVAANAVDDDASTRYTSGAGQAPGQWLQVDFGKPILAREVVFDTGASTGDYPRGYTAQVSLDGRHWTTVTGDTQGAGQFTTVEISSRRPVRYVRVTLTAASGSWWSVADVRAYGAAHEHG